MWILIKRRSKVANEGDQTSHHRFSPCDRRPLPIIEREPSWLRFVPERRLIFDHVAQWGDYERGVQAGVVAANCQFSDHVNEICTSTSRRREIEGIREQGEK